MANTLIKLKRGGGLNGEYITTSNFTTNIGTLKTSQGAFVRVEPWVCTNTEKQLWVDAVCINPVIKMGSSYYKPSDVKWDSTNNWAYLELPAVPNLASLLFASSNVAASDTGTNYPYNPSNSNTDVTLTFGKYLNFNANTGLVSVDISGISTDIGAPTPQVLTWKDTTNSIDADYWPFNTSTEIEEIIAGTGITFSLSNKKLTINSPIVESFLSGVAIQDGDGSTNMPNTSHKYMVFTFTTQGSPAATTLYADITDFYSDDDHTASVSTTDTGTSGLAVTSSTSGNNTNYDVHHKTITYGDTTPPGGTLTPAGNLTVITDIDKDNYGHILGVETTTYTMPTDTHYQLQGNATQYVAGWYLESSSGYVKLQHDPQTNSVGSMIEFNTQSKASDVTLTAKITIIDGGTFTNS